MSFETLVACGGTVAPWLASVTFAGPDLRTACLGSLRGTNIPAFTSPGWDIGLAVKENSRTLGDAAEDIIAAMTASGEMQALFDAHGVRYEKPAAG